MNLFGLTVSPESPGATAYYIYVRSRQKPASIRQTIQLKISHALFSMQKAPSSRCTCATCRSEMNSGGHAVAARANSAYVPDEPTSASSRLRCSPSQIW